jgi:hypothetical protein
MAPKPTNPFTAAHWRNRAEEARAVAENMLSGRPKLEMLQIAQTYDLMARRIDASELRCTAKKTA